MAGKQQEQSSVKSGDVLLLYEDGRGYVYSEITPILPEYASVCFYPVRPPYSKEDPGLPDVNCATFTVQLVSEKKKGSATPIYYGQAVKLRHTATRLFLAVSTTTTARSEPNLRVGLEACKVSCHFRIVPLHSDHALGSQVRFNQPVKFESVEVPDHYLHSSAQPYGPKFWIQPDRYELNLSSLATPLVMVFHHDCETESYGCRAGSLLQLSETKESMSVIAKWSRFRNPQDYSELPQLQMPKELNDVCAQDNYTRPEETWYPPSLWQFEEANDPRSGYFVKFNTDYRIKHTLTRKYLAVVECQHKNKGPDRITCVNCVKGMPLQVVLKDRRVIQQSGNEEEIVDDTVFTPISPDEQTSTHTVVEGVQLLLHHKKSGMWLNVYHGTVFEWHELLKLRSSDKWTVYNTAPYYEVDANKRLVAMAKDPFHAFTVRKSFQVSELLYDVAGVLPVLLAIVTKLLKSEEVDVVMLEPLKNLAKDPKCHMLIAHYGLIELLLTFKGKQLDLAFDVFKAYADKAPLYEKNRFVQLVVMVTPVYKAILDSVVGMEVNSAFMLNNKCQWVTEAESQLKLFIRHIEHCTPLVLDILGRLCLCSGKPVTAIQNAVVEKVLQTKQEVFYRIVKQDDSGSIAVVKEGYKQLLSGLYDEEIHFLRTQLTLFARICEGGNTKAIEAILDEEKGFMSFDGALVCAKNEDGSIPVDVQAEFIYLIRVLLFADFEEVDISHTLESPTWCFMQEDRKELVGKKLHATAAPSVQGPQGVQSLMNWVKTFSSSPQDVNISVLWKAMKLLNVLLKKGHYSGLEEIEQLFKNVLGFLKCTSSVTGHMNSEMIFQLIPLFFHLQLRGQVQLILKKGLKASRRDIDKPGVARMELQKVVLEEIKSLMDSGRSVPHDLLVCYFYWMKLHHDLFESSEYTTNEVLLLNKSKNVFRMAVHQYPKLKQHLKSFATPKQSDDIQDMLRDFGSKCVFKGIAHRVNQSIYSSIALDDILNCIFDRSASFPMWYWCNICSRAKDPSITTSVTVSACFKFLRTLAYSNFKVQKRLVQHLDDILPHCEVFPHQVAELLIEVFAGELARGSPEDAEKSVLSHVESIHLQIKEEHIKYLLQMATKNKMDSRHLLKALLFIIRYDEANLPITRNQEFVMRNLTLDNEHRAFLTHLSIEALESELNSTDSVNTQSLDYVLTMIDMLAACAEGESLSIDAICQSIYKTDALLGSISDGEKKPGILLNPKICPARKTPFLRFLVSVYMDCEGSVRVDAESPLMWEYLKTVVTFLRSFKWDVQNQLGQAQGTDEDAKCLSVQQSLMNALRPFGIPGDTDTNTIDTVIQRNDMKDLGGALYYLLKGVLPMLTEFYRCQSEEQQPLQGEHLDITQDICQSLWDVNDELTTAIVSSIHLRIYHLAIASVMNGIQQAGATPCVPKQEVLDTCFNNEVYDHLSIARKQYEAEFEEDNEETCKLRCELKQALNWTEKYALEKLLKAFSGEDTEEETEDTNQNNRKRAEECTSALGSVLTWLLCEAPLRDWPIYPYIPGLASRYLKALQRHVENLKEKDKTLEKSVYFNQFCQAFTEKGPLDEKSHLDEVLSLASASKMEEVSGEALNLLVIVLDSQNNPVRKYLGETIKTSGGRSPYLSDFLLAVHTCLRDSITGSNGRIAVRDETTKRRKATELFEESSQTRPQTIIEKNGFESIGAGEVHINFDSDRTQLFPMVFEPIQSFLQDTTANVPSADENDIDALIPRAESLKSMLKILALMCDEQNHSVQSYLKKQPGRINSVNIVGSVVELLNHIRKLHEDAKVSMPLSTQAMEIFTLTLQALIEFCAGNYENQEVMVYQQISSDLNWILSIRNTDNCQLNELKAIAVELIENLMEEVAEDSKELVKKLSEDEKLISTLKVATEDFNFHVYTHTTTRTWHDCFTDAFRREMGTTPPRPILPFAQEDQSIDSAEEESDCKQRMEQSRFRAYNFTRKLKQQREELEPALPSLNGATRKKKPPEPPGWKYCRKQAKTIEIFYKKEDTGDSIHTSVSFPYPYEDQLQEEVKDRINWEVDRSNPEDKLLDFVRYMKSARDDIEHQKWLANGTLRRAVHFLSAMRHYTLLLLTFYLNLLVLFTFMVNPDDIPPNGTEIIPLSEAKTAISPLTPKWADVLLYVLGTFHLFLSLWMVVEYFAVTGPHLIRGGWKSALPRSVLASITELMLKLKHNWKEHYLSEHLKPADEKKLEQSFYGWKSIFRMIFLLSSLLSLIPPLQGYFYCLCLLYVIEESDILWRVLQAVTKNGKSLLWVAFLGLIVLYMYAVLSFALLHESFFLANSRFQLHCENLAQCFVSVIRYGLLNTLGAVIPLISNDIYEFGWRLLYDISFFIIVTTIGLNIVFGIIVDTFSELRDERWKSEQDMKDRCFICSIPNHEFDRQQKNGFEKHVRHDHNMWNYIYYYVYVCRIPPRDRSAIQKYVHDKIERERIDFFPQKAALKLKDRAAEVTTEDLAKKVSKASRDLEAEISTHSKDTEEAVVSRLSKRLPRGSLQNVPQDQLLSIQNEMQEKFEDMCKKVDDKFEDVYKRVGTVQDELQKVRNDMQKEIEDVQKRVGRVHQTLIQEQMLIGQQFAGVHATMKTILDRLPAQGL